jgi:hypothetical protein
MTATDRFSLETHSGPYESWPLRTRLLMDGAPIQLTLSGFVLLHQFEIPAGYLLVTDYDCPFEEAVTFTLLSKDLQHTLGERTLGAMYGSFLLDGITWSDERNFSATFAGISGRWDFSIRDWSIPVIFPRLKMTHVRIEEALA